MTNQPKVLSVLFNVVRRRLWVVMAVLLLLVTLALAFAPYTVVLAGMAPGGSNP
jgi:hypothetical protein